MMFTGTLIEDLIATVERAEQRVQAAEDTEIIAALEDWFTASQDSANSDQYLGVA